MDAAAFINTREVIKAIKFERKLELGQEGHRYYDLQSWKLKTGITPSPSGRSTFIMEDWFRTVNSLK